MCIRDSPKSGSAFYNYKGYFPIVLLAVADADGIFLSVNVGEYLSLIHIWCTPQPSTDLAYLRSDTS